MQAPSVSIYGIMHNGLQQHSEVKSKILSIFAKCAVLKIFSKIIKVLISINLQCQKNFFVDLVTECIPEWRHYYSFSRKIISDIVCVQTSDDGNRHIFFGHGHFWHALFQIFRAWATRVLMI